MEGVSVVTIELLQDMDVDQSLQEAQREVEKVINDLPDDVDQPVLGKFDLDDLPILRMGVVADLSTTELYDLVDKRVQPQLAKIKGVAKVNIVGGQEREIQVKINSDKLAVYGVSLLQVRQMIASSNLDFPTGKMKDDKGQTTIRLSGKYKDIEQLNNLVISERSDGSVIKLRDFATVVDGEKDAEIITRVNGQNSIGLEIQKQSDANAVEIAAVSKALMSDLEKDYSESRCSNP
jgi:HAE1 family hydrophobic/amphiphilic exporter-1